MLKHREQRASEVGRGHFQERRDVVGGGMAGICRFVKQLQEPTVGGVM